MFKKLALLFAPNRYWYQYESIFFPYK